MEPLQTPQKTISLDFTALQRKIALSDIFRELKRYDLSWKIGMTILTLVALVALAIPVAMVATSFDSGGFAMTGFLLLVAGLGFGDAFGEIRKNVLMRRFAKDNALLFENSSTGDSYWGSYFRGKTVMIADMLRTPNRLFYELGNLRPYSDNKQRSSSGVTYGFVRIKLDRTLPHIMLQSKKGLLFPLPEDLDQKQHLSLEGNFDDYFTLYAPQHFEREALYIFTPDIMARFIDQLGQFNCEIIEDELYLFAQKKFDLTNPQVITDLFRLLADFVPKFDRKIAYFTKDADALAVDPTIAPPDRLKNDPIRSAVIITIGVISLIVLFIGAGILTHLSHQSGSHQYTWRLFASLYVTTLISGLITVIGQFWRRAQH